LATTSTAGVELDEARIERAKIHGDGIKIWQEGIYIALVGARRAAVTGPLATPSLGSTRFTGTVRLRVSRACPSPATNASQHTPMGKRATSLTVGF
jgi:hypothetical protein